MVVPRPRRPLNNPGNSETPPPIPEFEKPEPEKDELAKVEPSKPNAPKPEPPKRVAGRLNDEKEEYLDEGRRSAEK